MIRSTRAMHSPPDQSGQTLVEYALVLLLLVATVTMILIVIGPRIGVVMSNITSSIQGQPMVATSPELEGEEPEPNEPAGRHISQQLVKLFSSESVTLFLFIVAIPAVVLLTKGIIWLWVQLFKQTRGKS